MWLSVCLSHNSTAVNKNQPSPRFISEIERDHGCSLSEGAAKINRHHGWFPRSGEIIGRCRQNQLWPRLISKLAGRVMRLQLGQSGGSSLPNLAHMGHKRSQSLPRHSPTKMRPISECAISERRLHSSFPYSLFSTRTVWLGSYM